MGRLRSEFVERVEAFSHRVLDVTDEIEALGRSKRIIDQITGSGTSVGANINEADEAITRPMFVKCLAVTLQELAETGFWIRLISKRGWVKSGRLADLEQECREIRKIVGSMIVRTKRTSEKKPPAS